MRQDPRNPVRNCLPKSIAKEDLISGIEASGYPLQVLVASKLTKLFGVTEEWGYIDRDTQEHRTLDVFAFRRLQPNEPAAVHPRLALLIECKRAKHPYVCFKQATDRPIPAFPSVAGLRASGIPVCETDGRRTTYVPAAAVLGIDKCPFVAPGPPQCAAFSMAIPKGRKVELSGSDPFNSLIRPLAKALDFAIEEFGGSEHPNRIFPTLMVCISVIDAPMILIETPEKTSDPVLAPWVRIVRQEASTEMRLPSPRFYGIDAVHVDFFQEFLEAHLLPFADTFAARSHQLAPVLVKGGVVSSLDGWEWDELRPKGT